MTSSCKLALLTTAALGAATVGARADETVAVVASIKPIHSLVASVMEGVGTPDLLIRGGGSPHSYSLRPSDAAALERADVVFWVGEGLETFLGDAIATISEDADSVELGEVDGIIRLEARTGSTWDDHDHDHDEAHDHDEEYDHEEEHDHAHDDEHTEDDGHDHAHDEEHEHEEEHDHAHDDEHDHGETDAHPWLDPVNAQVMVAEIAARLSAADPDHAEAYRQNAAETQARLEALIAEIEATLAPVQGQPFIVFHDAYHAMQNRFDLNAVGSITITPDIQPGAARLVDIRAKIEELGAVCVFTEPQFEPSLVETVVEGTDARTGILDPLGADLDDGPDLYFELMLRNAQALSDCLGQTE